MFLTLAPSNPGVKVQDIHLIRDSVGPRIGLDTVVERNLCYCWESNPDSLVLKPTAYSL
jgi:hypothetical protein